MDIAGMRKLEIPALLHEEEPVLVTREGQLSGLYLPLKNPDQTPEDLYRDLIFIIRRHLLFDE